MATKSLFLICYSIILTLTGAIYFSLANHAEINTTTTTTTLAPPTISPPAIEETTTVSPIEDISTTTKRPDENLTTTPTPTPPTTTTTVAPTPRVCKNIKCLHGGTCIVDDKDQEICICPPEFYGARCQSRDYCKSVIVDSLTGSQICQKLDRKCAELNDKYFTCICHEDEYFVFKIDSEHNRNSATTTTTKTEVTTGRGSLTDMLSTQPQTFSYDDINPTTTTPMPPHPSYTAECRRFDDCVGVRCRQISEVCKSGKCVCNSDMGYIEDPSDHLCKLLNPCLLATADGSSICGQANCIATYDEELYKCICPIGYKSIQVGHFKNSTQCALLTDIICEIPLLNKCQHICKVDQSINNYKCSCLPGYKPGTRQGVDDHMCFFQVQTGPIVSGRASTSEPAYVFRKIYSKTTLPNDSNLEEALTSTDTVQHSDYIIKLVPASSDEGLVGSRQSADGDPYEVNQGEMSAQDRCNKLCDENKICVLESKDSYRCVCDRQGYVSDKDLCKDWCSVKSNSSERSDLDSVCYSGACNQIDEKPTWSGANNNKDENAKLIRDSSWRPKFECDCTTSPLLYMDPGTRLCKLNFTKIIEPCLPHNEGYTDCVENKKSYCAVLYRPFSAMAKDFRKKKEPTGADGSSGTVQPNEANKSKLKDKNKLYTCVCSPEKKFLVDKPRNKARCVNECDLLANECGRFNRMCRAATIEAGDYGKRNLVRIDPDGVRMHFRRTGCECLPGFNVGSQGLIYFTMDDSQPIDLQPNPFSFETYNLHGGETLIPGDLSMEPDHLRTRYMNINSRCLLDYDVVEFHAGFKAPPHFEPSWVKIREKSLEHKQLPTKRPLTQENSSSMMLSSSNSTKQKVVHESNDKSIHNPIETERDQEPPSMGYSSASKDEGRLLVMPDYMRVDIDDFHKSVVFIAQCEQSMAPLSLEALQQCIEYRYWIVHKLRHHFVDWRETVTNHLKQTFDLMEGNIRLYVNKCEAVIRNISTISMPQQSNAWIDPAVKTPAKFDELDPYAVVDADFECVLTLHAASDETSPKYRTVKLEKQLPRFIFNQSHKDYYLMAPNTMLQRETFDNLSNHRKDFNPCKSDYTYCSKQTKCAKVGVDGDTVNFTCTCETGYTPIGSRDLYLKDSRKEVCEDIDECLFEVCKEAYLENISTCINEEGDYRCQCNRHYVGDNKRYCRHVCSTLPCQHGTCLPVDDHHAFCQCDDGYKELDCSVQDPNVALRKANTIICGSIFTSVLLLAITLAVNLNSQLKKTKKKLKRLEAANETAQLFDLSHQNPFRSRMSKVSVA